MSGEEQLKELGYRRYPYNDIDHLFCDIELKPQNKKCLIAYEKYNEKHFSFNYILIFDDKTFIKWSSSYQRIMYISKEELEAIYKQYQEIQFIK